MALLSPYLFPLEIDLYWPTTLRAKSCAILRVAVPQNIAVVASCRYVERKLRLEWLFTPAPSAHIGPLIYGHRFSTFPTEQLERLLVESAALANLDPLNAYLEVQDFEIVVGGLAEAILELLSQAQEFEPWTPEAKDFQQKAQELVHLVHSEQGR